MLISKFGHGEGAVAWLEARIGCQLPADYASFLRTYNGGFTYKTEVKLVANVMILLLFMV